MMVPAANLGDASSIDDTVLAGRPVAEAPLDEAMAGEESSDDEPSEDEPDFETDTAFELDDDPDPAIAEDVPGEVVPNRPPRSCPPRPTPRSWPSRRRPMQADDEADDDDEMTATDIDGLFARIRADQPVDGATDEADEDAAEELEQENPFRRRDAALVPLIVASARKLKRVLADEQNEVLDVLRHREPVTDLDRLVTLRAHAGRPLRRGGHRGARRRRRGRGRHDRR